MTNPSEIESHPVETLKAQKHADHPIPPTSQTTLEAVGDHIGAGVASSGVISIPFISKEEGHHEHKHHDVHHEGHAHDHHGNPQEPLKNKSLGFDAHQLPTM